jgi:hypothetical protein
LQPDGSWNDPCRDSRVLQGALRGGSRVKTQTCWLIPRVRAVSAHFEPSCAVVQANKARRPMARDSRRFRSNAGTVVWNAEVRILAPQPASPCFYATLRLSVKCPRPRRMCGLWPCLRIAKSEMQTRISAAVPEGQFSVSRFCFQAAAYWSVIDVQCPNCQG